MFLAVIDDFSTFTWYDNTGTAHTFNVDQSGMFVQAMIKIISGILLLKQAT
jgi:lipoprotein signal peptidase